MEEGKINMNEPSRIPDNYTVKEKEDIELADGTTVKGKTQADADIDEVFAGIDKPMIATNDGNFINAKEVVAAFDDDLKGIQTIEECFRG